MIKKIFILLFILFQIEILYADYNNERSAEASQVWNKIDDLEKEKPLLRAVILYCDNQLPIAKSMKSKVESYAQKVTIAYKSNAIKTIISGGLAAASEITGGISGKGLVDLGLWLTNKGLSIAMGNSSTFGGVSSYKRSIGGFLSANHTLTKELNKLYKISKTSDVAIQAYYNKNGRYRDLLGPLGDVGIFTTRMRLVIEQTVPTIASLKNLISKLEDEKENTTSKLKQLNRKLARLKKKLKDLNEKQKVKKIKEIKPKLSDEEIEKGNISILKPSIVLGHPDVCNNDMLRQKRIKNLEKRYSSITITLNEQIRKLNSLRKNYFDKNSITEKKKKYYINKFNKTLNSIPLPTGYEIPMSKRLSVEETWLNTLMKAQKALTASFEKFTSNLVTDLPGDELAKTISQEISNRNLIGATLISGCLSDLDFVFPSISPVVDYPQMLRNQKKQMLMIIAERKSEEKGMKPYIEKYINTMRLDFHEKRKQMEDAISKYERSISKNETFEHNLMADMISLQNLYKSGLFISKDNKWGKNYYLKLKIEDSDTVCQTVKKIRHILDSPNVQNVISLEKKIKTYLSYSSTYAALSIPKAAFTEFGKDIEIAQKNHMTHKNNFSIALNTYRDSSSDTQFVYNAFSQNEFSKVSQLRPLYVKLASNANILNDSIKNLRVNIENSLSAKAISDQEYLFLQGYYKKIIKKIKKDFFCIPLTCKLLNGTAEDLEDVKPLLSKVSSKPRYREPKVRTKSIKRREEVKIKSIENTTEEANMKRQEDIRSLYSKFSQYYSEKDVASLVGLLSNDWESSSDGTTIMDLEDTLNNSFSVFDEVQCTIDSLNITNIGSNKYSVTYIITIKGFIDDEDIEHLEKSSVKEEVIFDNEVPKIYKTFGGHYWKTR